MAMVDTTSVPELVLLNHSDEAEFRKNFPNVPPKERVIETSQCGGNEKRVAREKFTTSERYVSSQASGSHYSSTIGSQSSKSGTVQSAGKELCSFSPMDYGLQSRSDSGYPAGYESDEATHTTVNLNQSTVITDVSRYFPLLPKEEIPGRCFKCSLVCGTVHSGKLCATRNYVLFYSPMMDSGISLKFTEIESIEKERKMTILDGLSIRKKNGEELTFTNFVSRDAAYNMLIKSMIRTKQFQTSLEISTDENPLAIKTSTCTDVIEDIPTAESLDEFSAVSTEYGSAFSNYSCFTKEVITPVELPTGKSVIDVFAACFDDGAPLLEQYHADRGDRDQKWENWRPVPDGRKFFGQREFICTTLVKAMMNKPYSFYEYQRYGFLNVNGSPTLLLQFSSQVPGVMFGESFRVEALSVFSQVGEGPSAKVTMRAYCYVQFLKSVWVKGKINSTSHAEQSNSYKKISEMIVKRLNTVECGRGETKAPPSVPNHEQEHNVEGLTSVPFVPMIKLPPVERGSVYFFVIIGVEFLFACVSLYGSVSNFSYPSTKVFLTSVVSRVSSVVCGIVFALSIQCLISTVSVNMTLQIQTSTCTGMIEDIPTAESLDEFSAVSTEYGSAFSNYSCFTKEVITPVELPTGKSVIDVFAACFDDGAPLLEQYHADRGDTDQKWENWRPVPDGRKFFGQREFICTTLVKAMMNKPYSFYEYQRYGFLNVNGSPTLLLQFSSQVPGVMFGESFRVEALSVFSQVGEGPSAKVTMRVYCYVQFLKSVWVKGKINSTSHAEQSNSYKKISEMVVRRLTSDSEVQTVEPAPVEEPVLDSVEKKTPELSVVMYPQPGWVRGLYYFLSWSSIVWILVSCGMGLFEVGIVFTRNNEYVSAESEEILHSVTPILFCFYVAVMLIAFKMLHTLRRS